MRKNNNKGSSLILAIVLFAVILTIGGALLTVVNTNYRVRVKEGRRLQNLYEAEAGLDVAYNIVTKVFDAAVLAGNEAVTVIEDKISENSKKEQEFKRNIAFKKGFKEYISKYQQDKSSNINEFKECIDGNKYIDITQYNSDDEQKKYKQVQFKTEDSSQPPSLKYEDIDTSNLVEIYNTKSDLKDEYYDIKVSSEFKSSDSTGENLRKIQVTYEVKIPDYENTQKTTTKNNVEIPSELKEKIIAIDGNMNVLGDKSDINIKGDVFVKGNSNEGANEGIAYEKYNGGIKVEGKNTKLLLDGSVSTSKTFNIDPKEYQSDINVEIADDLYAGNVYIGGENGTYSNPTKASAVINRVITDNDLVIKSKKSNLTINDFYGINDKTYVDGKENRTSSSIIVNNGSDITGENVSTININNSAYISGVAYVNAQNSKTGKYYQTGESIAVKGNYIAYTMPLDKFSDYNFSMYGPLQMVDSKTNKPLDVIAKSEYFEEFVSKHNDKVSLGGVTLPKETYAVGAVLHNDSNNNIVASRSTYTKEVDSTIINKRIEYATEVYGMGNLDGLDAIEKYEKLGEYQKTIGDLIDFTKVKGYISDDREPKKIILNNDVNKTIVLCDSSYTPISGEIAIKAQEKSGEINAVIITSGNVKVVGDFNYNGMIIAKGNLDIKNKLGNMTYDEKIVSEIMAKYSDKLDGVFKTSTTAISTFNELQNDNVQYMHTYETKKYVKSKLWKIVK